MPWRTNVLTTFRTRETLEISDQENSGSVASGIEVADGSSCNQVDKNVGQALEILDSSLNEFHDA